MDLLRRLSIQDIHQDSQPISCAATSRSTVLLWHTPATQLSNRQIAQPKTTRSHTCPTTQARTVRRPKGTTKRCEKFPFPSINQVIGHESSQLSNVPQEEPLLAMGREISAKPPPSPPSPLLHSFNLRPNHHSQTKTQTHHPSSPSPQ